MSEYLNTIVFIRCGRIGSSHYIKTLRRLLILPCFLNSITILLIFLASKRVLSFSFEMSIPFLCLLITLRTVTLFVTHSHINHIGGIPLLVRLEGTKDLVIGCDLLLGASNCLHGMPRSRRVMGLFWSDWREAAVLFVTYRWGKPQPPTCRGNAESRFQEAGRR